ncbi:Integrase core domain [Actinomyces slackii]|uniref:Integrase core domain n=1 Tax=Actinomyces slackii TaxID=52774 RepID=A0A448KFQ7_9ACTO|nr:Uncharacterised protein [Actinomyces slackii]
MDRGGAPGPATEESVGAASVAQGGPRAAPRQRDPAVGFGVFRSKARPAHEEVIRSSRSIVSRPGVRPSAAPCVPQECGFITSRGYRAAKSPPASTGPAQLRPCCLRSSRSMRRTDWVYGAGKMRQAMLRAGWADRPIRQPGSCASPGHGGCVVVTGPVTTGRAGEPDTRPDLVQRQFSPERPDQLWVADITYIRTLLPGRCRGCAAPRSSPMPAAPGVSWGGPSQGPCTLPLAGLALEHALASTGTTGSRQGLVHHSDRGAQYACVAYWDALVTAGVTASPGFRGRLALKRPGPEQSTDSYKTELIGSQRLWQSTQAVELATMGRSTGGTQPGCMRRFATPPRPKSKPSTLTSRTQRPLRPDHGTKPRALHDIIT